MDKHHEDLATLGELAPLLVWVSAITKSLVRNNVISKSQLIDELVSQKGPGVLLDYAARIDRMIDTVRKC